MATQIATPSKQWTTAGGQQALRFVYDGSLATDDEVSCELGQSGPVTFLSRLVLPSTGTVDPRWGRDSEFTNDGKNQLERTLEASAARAHDGTHLVYYLPPGSTQLYCKPGRSVGTGTCFVELVVVLGATV
jgi:hypothetical protein